MKKIFRTKKYDRLLFLFCAMFFLVGMIIFIPLSYPLDIKDILCIIATIIISLFGFFLYLYYYQIVIFNEEGIVFKSLLYSNKIIKWNNVKKISVISKKTYTTSNGYNAYYNWIKIETDINKKNFLSIPNEIIYTKENFSILCEFVQKYNSKIEFYDIDENISEKPTGGFFK